MASQYKNFINGKWLDSKGKETFMQKNPANTDIVTGIWPASNKEDIKNAISAAQDAYIPWKKLSVYERAEYLKKALQILKEKQTEIARVITSENGKTLRESLAEIYSALIEMEYQINEGLRLNGQVLPSVKKDIFSYSTRVPLGVVAIISPWNFPFNVPCRKVVPALISGNTCVFKPASLTPKTGKMFVDLFIEAGIPKGVLNFVTGSGSVFGKEITKNKAIKAISFTGSTNIGRNIYKESANNMARTQLEMGGKNPVIVLDDCDIDQAVDATVTAAFACAGQWCTSTSRVIVLKSIGKEFIEKVISKTRKMVIGDGEDKNVTMGPVCGKEQFENILKYIEIGKSEGAKLLLGGSSVKKGKMGNGYFIKPTIFTQVRENMVIASEEIFGPVLSIVEVDDFKQAMEIANNVEYGLSSSIFTSDIKNAFRFLDETDVGLTHVNLMTAYKEPQYSFGGTKASGFGAPEAGSTGIEFFTEHKIVYVKTS